MTPDAIVPLVIFALHSAVVACSYLNPPPSSKLYEVPPEPGEAPSGSGTGDSTQRD